MMPARARSDAVTEGNHVAPNHAIKVVYAPFSTAEAQGNRLLGTSWEAQKKYIVRRHGDSPKPLAWDTSVVIYLVCHAAIGYEFVEDNAGNKLTFDQLAQRIEEDGLDKKHKVMKFYACQSGAGGDQSCAKKLLTALRSRGYNDLTMYAYTENLSPLDADGHKWALMPNVKTPPRARDARVLVK